MLIGVYHASGLEKDDHNAFHEHFFEKFYNEACQAYSSVICRILSESMEKRIFIAIRQEVWLQGDLLIYELEFGIHSYRPHDARIKHKGKLNLTIPPVNFKNKKIEGTETTKSENPV